MNPSVLQSSGIYLHPEFIVEHYRNRKLQENLINPPFYIKTTQLSEELISGFSELMGKLLSSLNPEIVDRGEKSQPYLHSLNYLDYIPKDLGNSAILLIQVNEHRISAMKGFGLALLSAAASSSSHIGAGYYVPNSDGETNAFLIHAKSGKLLWSDFRYTGISSAHIHRLFNRFPEKKISD